MSVSTGHGKRSVGSGCILKVGAVGRPSRLDVGCKGGDDGGARLGSREDRVCVTCSGRPCECMR